MWNVRKKYICGLQEKERNFLKKNPLRYGENPVQMCVHTTAAQQYKNKQNTSNENYRQSLSLSLCVYIYLYLYLYIYIDI